MAGGVWLSQNKVRPGAYINFKAVQKGSMTVGDRGIIAIPLALLWGKEGELIEVLSSELLSGDSQSKVGFTAFDAESKLLARALSYCYKALVFNTRSGGDKATATAGCIKATAKHSGTYGNRIVLTITHDGTDGTWTFITYVDGVSVDKQLVAEASELEGNDYLDFAVLEGDLEETAGTPLAGGTDDEADEAAYFPEFFKLL